MGRTRFRGMLVALVGFYLALELVYVQRLPLAMDEFQFASEIERLRHETPYLDFVPYKNLLGYTLQSASFALGRALGLTPWSNLILLKSLLAVAVASAIGLTAWRMRRWFDETAILSATALLVPMSTFLERSAVLRVDMMASLFGLAAVMAAISGAWGVAGGLVGIAFLVTQKAAYFVVSLAAVIAFDACRTRAARESLARGARFAIAALVPLLIYVTVYGASSSFEAVLDAMFVRSSQVAVWTDYADLRGTFWWQTLSRNPVFYAISFGGLLVLLASASRALSGARRNTIDDRGQGGSDDLSARHLLAVHGLVLAVLCALHRQPWPYFFVFLIPSAWLTSIAAFEWLEGTAFDRLGVDRRRIAIAIVVVIGVAIPASRIPTALERDNAYQRSNFEVLDAMLGPDETYLAGVNVLYHRAFQPEGVRWLDRRRIAEIESQSPEERAVFLAALDAAPIKAVVRNYRTGDLPDDVRAFLNERYRPIYGSISSSAPACRSGLGVEVRFPGTYLVWTGGDQARVRFEGRVLRNKSAVTMTRGRHAIEPADDCRLQLVPEVSADLADAGFARKRPFFEDVYTY